MECGLQSFSAARSWRQWLESTDGNDDGTALQVVVALSLSLSLSLLWVWAAGTECVCPFCWMSGVVKPSLFSDIHAAESGVEHTGDPCAVCRPAVLCCAALEAAALDAQDVYSYQAVQAIGQRRPLVPGWW